MSFELRPLSIGELFDRAFTLYRRFFGTFVGIMVIPGVLALLMNVAIQLGQYAIMPAAADHGAPTPRMADAQLMATVVATIGAAFVFGILYIIVYMVALGASTFAVSEVYADRAISVRESYGRVQGRIGSLLLLMLLLTLRFFGVLVVFGALVAIAVGLTATGNALGAIAGGLLFFVAFLLLFVGMIYFMLRYSLAVPALIVEQIKATPSIQRSVELSRGNMGRVFLLAVCSTAVTYAALMLVQTPFIIAAALAGPGTTLALWLTMAGVVFGTLGTTVTTPFLIIGLAVIYYDVRIRKEGLDLDMMIASLDGGVSPANA